MVHGVVLAILSCPTMGKLSEKDVVMKLYKRVNDVYKTY